MDCRKRTWRDLQFFGAFLAHIARQVRISAGLSLQWTLLASSISYPCRIQTNTTPDRLHNNPLYEVQSCAGTHYNKWHQCKMLCLVLQMPLRSSQPPHPASLSCDKPAAGVDQADGCLQMSQGVTVQAMDMQDNHCLPLSPSLTDSQTVLFEDPALQSMRSSHASQLRSIGPAALGVQMDISEAASDAAVSFNATCQAGEGHGPLGSGAPAVCVSQAGSLMGPDPLPPDFLDHLFRHSSSCAAAAPALIPAVSPSAASIAVSSRTYGPLLPHQLALPGSSLASTAHHSRTSSLHDLGCSALALSEAYSPPSFSQGFEVGRFQPLSSSLPGLQRQESLASRGTVDSPLQQLRPIGELAAPASSPEPFYQPMGRAITGTNLLLPGFAAVKHSISIFVPTETAMAGLVPALHLEPLIRLPLAPRQKRLPAFGVGCAFD